MMEPDRALGEGVKAREKARWLLLYWNVMSYCDVEVFGLIGGVVTLAVKRALVAVAIFLGESTWEAGVHASEERQKPAAIRE
ncbi:hypothetical protein AFK49_006110 [Corynebacterium ulcerans]|nr:hypothetical protein [Corynebacterium ulcerans]OAG71338.1 hypothetical protein AFK49_006110 [Corynebacterium ulcerans]